MDEMFSLKKSIVYVLDYFNLFWNIITLNNSIFGVFFSTVVNLMILARDLKQKKEHVDTFLHNGMLGDDLWEIIFCQP